MKKILLFASLLLTSMTTFAQMPDASKWQKGDEITGQIGWGNLSFEEPEGAEGSMNYWKLDGSAGGFTKSGGLFEAWNGSNVDLYQYVQLPAGMYRIECQGYYRCGNSWADDPNAFGTENWLDNALLYVQNGTYDIESEAFTPSRTFKTPLMPRLFLNYGEQIYIMPEGESTWDMSDGDYGAKGWGPTSVPGSLAWFNLGLYQPYVDEDYDETKIKYNTTSFWLKEDGYVRIGVSKIEPKSEDSFMATNFKMYYEGEVDAEMAELLALQEEVQEYYDQLVKIEESYSEGGMLYALINDNMPDWEPSDLEADECAAAKEELKNLLEQVQAAELVYNQLKTALPGLKLLYSTTDYPGKDSFKAALEAAQGCIDPQYEMEGTETFGTFQQAYDNLVAARLAYLMSPDKVNGAWDFSTIIANRFFTNEVNNPVWSNETNFWEYNQELKDANPDFFNAMEFDGGNETMKEQRAAVSGEVVLSGSDTTIPFKWYKTGNNGPGWEVYYDHKLTSCKAWAPTPTSGISVIGQYLKGLPNGFYSLTGMAEAWTNEGVEASDNHFIIRSTSGSSRSERAEPRAWWNGNTPASWNTLSTGMVEVTDGDLWVEASVNGFYSITGFQLYYYGATPDFASLLKPMIEKAEANINDNLIWAGDIKKAKAILAAIDIENITDGEGYLTAQAAIAEANEYVATASAAVNNWKGIENFTNLAAKYEDGSVENEIANTAMMESLMIGEGENDTYELAVQNDKDYAAYVTYLDFRAAMGELIDAPAVAAVVTEQNKSLMEKMANDKELAEMQAALALPYNKALLASLGTADASESNPVDITALLVNPKFDEGNKGWTGNPTLTSPEAIDAELGAAEMWNCNFDVYQTLYSLPAGCYKVECQALYRDAGDAKGAYNNWWYGAGADMEYWDNQNAKLYANKQETVINSIASVPFTDRSMTAFRDKMILSEEADDEGNERWVEHWKTMSLDAIDLPEGLAEEQIEINTDGWWWDMEIDDVDELYYYPSSLMGISHRLTKNPEAYKTEVLSMVEEGGSLRLGVKKETLVSNDWVVFDNFKLYYLGTEIPTGIDEAAAAKAQVAGVFSLSGAQQQGLQKGINIVKMSDGTVRKVLVK